MDAKKQGKLQEPERDPALLALAGEILDGTPVQAGSRDSDPARPLIDELQAISAIVRLSRELHGRGPVRAASSPPAESLSRWGHLELLERVAAGTFGEVFRAWDTRLDREVALKLLYETYQPNDSAGAVIAEGRLLARVRHPNVVTVYGAERIDRRVGIWTEFVHGETLATRVHSSGPLTAPEAIAIGIQLCGALAAVHDAGLVHGDVKAQNVIRVPDGRIVLVDLGTGSEHLHDLKADERAVALAGTPAYMAPELLQLGHPSPRSDIYSLGVLLYYVVTGSYPVPGETVDDIRSAHATGSRLCLSSTRPNLPSRFVQGVDVALSPEPDDRFATADAMRRALERAGRAKTSVTWRIAVVVSLVTAVGAAAAYLMPRSNEAPAARSPAASASQTRTELKLPPLRLRGRSSRDGRYVPFVEPNGQVALWDRTSGSASRVTAGSTDTGAGEWTAASPDGKAVAYTWYTPAGAELRVASSDGSVTRVLAPAVAGGNYEPLEWDVQGRRILSWFTRPEGGRDLLLVPADGAPVQMIQRAVRTGPHAGASLSRDGRLIVYEAFQSEQSVATDLMIVNAHPGADARRLVVHSTNDFNPVWTPAGNVVFASDRSRHRGLYHLRIANDEPVEPPELLVRDLEMRKVLGLSDSGVLFYEARSGSADAHVARIDLSGRVPVKESLPVDPLREGDHTFSNWSADGGTFVYAENGTNRLFVRDTQSGETREFRVPLFVGNQHRLSPDGKRLVARGGDLNNRPGFFLIDLTTESVRALIRSGSESYLQVEWASDSRRLFFRHRQRGIVEFDTQTLRERLLIPAVEMPGAPSGFRVRPDGAILVASEVPSDAGREVVFRLWESGRGPDVIARLAAPVQFVNWSADATDLIYLQPSGQNGHIHLWAMPVRGGAVSDLGALPGYEHIRRGVALHPEGTHVAYPRGAFRSALWILERFLPETPAR